MVATQIDNDAMARALPSSCVFVGEVQSQAGTLIAIVRHQPDGQYAKLTLVPSAVYAGSYNTSLSTAFDQVHSTSSLTPKPYVLRPLIARAHRLVAPRGLQTIIWRSLVWQLQKAGSINAEAAFAQVIEEAGLQNEPFDSWDLYKHTLMFSRAWHQLVGDILAA